MPDDLQFAIGQKFVSKRLPPRYAEVVQLQNEGVTALVDLRDADGTLQETVWVGHVQFAPDWALIR